MRKPIYLSAKSTPARLFRFQLLDIKIDEEGIPTSINKTYTKENLLEPFVSSDNRFFTWLSALFIYITPFLILTHVLKQKKKFR